MSRRKDMADQPTGNDRIAALLAAYGSDVTRWPAEGQAALDALSPAERRRVVARRCGIGCLIGRRGDDSGERAGAGCPDGAHPRGSAGSWCGCLRRRFECSVGTSEVRARSLNCARSREGVLRPHRRCARIGSGPQLERFWLRRWCSASSLDQPIRAAMPHKASAKWPALACRRRRCR